MPKYIYGISGNLSFGGQVVNDDGFISDLIPTTITMTNKDPETILSSDKLIAEKNEVIRFFAIESTLYGMNEYPGLGGCKYWWEKDSGGFGFTTTVPYKDFSWNTIGAKSVKCYMTNADGQPVLPPVSPASIDIEIVDELINEIYSDIIDITDFSNGYTQENITGGRELEIDENLESDEKTIDSPVMSTRSLRISGQARTISNTHPIAKVDTWRTAQSLENLPDDLVTLKYLEEHKSLIKMTIEEEESYWVMSDFSRDRTWMDLEKRNWSVVITKVK
jgi:hypothetical protein